MSSHIIIEYLGLVDVFQFYPTQSTVFNVIAVMLTNFYADFGLVKR